MNKIENKKFISTKEAAKLTGYTSDYIGQLARANKIFSNMVGHARFVDRDSVIAYKNRSKENHENGGRKKYTQPEISAPTLGPNEIRDINKTKAILPLPATFVRDSKGTIVRKASIRKELVESSIVPKDFFNRAVAVFLAGLVVFGSFVLYEQHREKIITFTPTSVSSSSFETDPHFTFRRAWKELDTFVDNGLTASAEHALSGLDVVADAVGVKPASSALSQFGWSMYQAIANLFRQVAGWFSSPDESPYYAVVPEKETPGLQDEGLVVVPTGSDDLSNKDRLQRVRDSFSDEVVIEPDESGQSGIIRPIFRATEGESFLYLLVPVEKQQE